MKKILTLTAALAAAATLAACSSGGGAGHTSSGPPPSSASHATTSSATSAPTTQQVKCTELGGTPVPKTLTGLHCTGSYAAMSFGCYPGGHHKGSFFFVDPFVGRPGGSWVRANTTAMDKLATLVGC